MEFLVPWDTFNDRKAKNQIIRSHSLNKVSSSIINFNNSLQIPDFSKKSAINLYHKQSASAIVPLGLPLQQITIPFNNRNSIVSSKMHKTSRLASELNIIRETKREYNPN